MNQTKLIKSIQVSEKRVDVGSSFLVSVETQKSQPEGRVDVFIEGVLGNAQYLFIENPGVKKIRVTAASKGSYDHEEVEVKIVAVDNLIQYPTVATRLNPFHYMVVDFDILNWAELNLQSPLYLWDFGDKSTTQTIVPAASHYYGDSMDENAEYTSFQTKVTIREPGRCDRIRFNTVTLWNYYYADKLSGLIKPRVETGGKAVRSGSVVIGSFVIHNAESEVLRFTSKRIDYLSSDLKAPYNPEEKYEFEIASKKSSIQTIQVPYANLPKGVFGFAVHLRGKSASGLNVSASAYLNFKDPPGVKTVNSPAAIALLNKLNQTKSFGNKSVIRDDLLYEFLRQGRFGYDPTETPSSLSKNITAGSNQVENVINLDQYEQIDPNLVNIIDNGNSLQPPPLPANLQQLIGQECNCQGCPYPDPRVTCQLTSQVKWVRVPAHFPNAQKGDAILSPGGNGLIGKLLMRLTPPQVHSHSAIMVEDFFRFRHSTASVDRLNDKNYFTGSFLGQPMPTDGLRPDHLKYAWPGTLTQSVDEAFLGTQFGAPSVVNGGLTNQPDPSLYPYFRQDPENNLWYPIQTGFFSPGYVDYMGRWTIVNPVVVKPPWQLDLLVRPILHQVADQAVQVSAHYRFYCYSAAKVSLDPQYSAPASSGWANGTLPTVCSSFIWTSIQLLNAKLASQGQKQIELDGTRGGRWITKPWMVYISTPKPSAKTPEPNCTTIYLLRFSRPLQTLYLHGFL